MDFQGTLSKLKQQLRDVLSQFPGDQQEDGNAAMKGTVSEKQESVSDTSPLDKLGTKDAAGRGAGSAWPGYCKGMLAVVKKEGAQEDAAITLTVNDRAVHMLAFRSVLGQELEEQADFKPPHTSSVGVLLDLAIRCCSASEPLLSLEACFLLLEQVFECETIEACLHVFEYMKRRTEALRTLVQKKKLCGLSFLRICNGLLRRLSKTTHTSFCGQLLLLMANMYPLDEPSGQNKFGKFNTSNVTSFEDVRDEPDPKPESESKPEKMADEDENEGDGEDQEKIAEGDEGEEEEAPKETEEDKEKRIQAEKKAKEAAIKQRVLRESKNQRNLLYRAVWSIQDKFADPNLLSHADKWLKFQASTELILKTFETQQLSRQAVANVSANSSFFPKYLTGNQLLGLQMRDPTFRRHLLIQFLILMQYLQGCKKVDVDKGAAGKLVLKATQLTFVAETTSRCRTLLKATPGVENLYEKKSSSSKRSSQKRDREPGRYFASDMDKIIKRETNWTAWKDTKPQCQVLTMPAIPKDTTPLVLPKPKTASKATAKGKAFQRGAGGNSAKRRFLRMGTVELERLWSLSDSNLDALKAEERDFNPQHPGFFEKCVWEELDALAEEDEDFKIKDDEKLNRDTIYTWRCLRNIAMNDFQLFTKANGSLIKICGDEVEARRPKPEPEPEPEVKSNDVPAEVKSNDVPAAAAAPGAAASASAAPAVVAPKAAVPAVVDPAAAAQADSV